MIPRWLTPWLRPKSTTATGLPWGITSEDVAALKALRASPQWPRYERILAAVAEGQATEFAAGLPHDRYLYACGALSAFRRVYTLVDDLIETATRLETATNDHTRRTAADRVLADPFVNTSWWGATGTARREH